jgi:hypothetical protein
MHNIKKCNFSSQKSVCKLLKTLFVPDIKIITKNKNNREIKFKGFDKIAIIIFDSLFILY